MKIYIFNHCSLDLERSKFSEVCNLRNMDILLMYATIIL